MNGRRPNGDPAARSRLSRRSVNATPLDDDDGAVTRPFLPAIPDVPCDPASRRIRGRVAERLRDRWSHASFASRVRDAYEAAERRNDRVLRALPLLVCGAALVRILLFPASACGVWS